MALRNVQWTKCRHLRTPLLSLTFSSLPYHVYSFQTSFSLSRALCLALALSVSPFLPLTFPSTISFLFILQVACTAHLWAALISPMWRRHSTTTQLRLLPSISLHLDYMIHFLSCKCIPHLSFPISTTAYFHKKIFLLSSCLRCDSSMIVIF